MKNIDTKLLVQERSTSNIVLTIYELTYTHTYSTYICILVALSIHLLNNKNHQLNSIYIFFSICLFFLIYILKHFECFRTIFIATKK